MEIINTESPLQVYNDLVKQDERLNEFNLPITRSFSFDNSISGTDFIYPGSSFGVDHPMFVWPPEDGFRSVSRPGFYKIISEVSEQEDTIFTNGDKYKSYSARVLFCKNIGDQQYFEFYANIGPLVNAHAVIFDLSPTRKQKVLKFPNSNSYMRKLPFLQEMFGKTFYVSKQQRIGQGNKQTFWFKL